MFETALSNDQTEILRRAHQLRADTTADMLRALVAWFRRKPATVIKTA